MLPVDGRLRSDTWMCFTLACVATVLFAGAPTSGRAAEATTVLDHAGFRTRAHTTGIEFTAGQDRVGMRFAGYQRGARTLSPGRPRLSGSPAGFTYTYPEGTVETYRPLPGGIEQVFMLPTRPLAGTTGDLVLRLDLSGGTIPVQTEADGRITFLTARGERISYSKLMVFDATARTLDSDIHLRENQIALVIDDTHATYPLLVDPWIEQAVLMADDGTSFDEFGTSVAVDGDTAVVGAPLDDHAGGNDAGSVYIYTRAAGSWTPQAKLTAGDAVEGDRFGSTVAIDGDTVLVGAPFDDHPTVFGSNHGSAYVYTRTGSSWTPQAKLTASDAANSDAFGTSVAVNGDTAIMGATADFHSGKSNAGSAYVYTRALGSWSPQTKLIASDPGANDRFGNAVAVDADTAVIAASLDDHATGFDQGSVYVYTRTADSWGPPVKLTADDASIVDTFGSSVALDGDTIVVGAFSDDHSGAGGEGSAYVFTRTAGTWTPVDKFIASDNAPGDRFGRSVAIHEDTAVVGAPGDDHDAGGSGSAYVYTRETAGWIESTKLTASDAAVHTGFGGAVATSGGTVVAGSATGAHAGGSNAGSAYVYTLTAAYPPVGGATFRVDRTILEAGQTLVGDVNLPGPWTRMRVEILGTGFVTDVPIDNRRRFRIQLPSGLKPASYTLRAHPATEIDGANVVDIPILIAGGARRLAAGSSGHDRRMPAGLALLALGLAATAIGMCSTRGNGL